MNLLILVHNIYFCLILISHKFIILEKVIFVANLYFCMILVIDNLLFFKKKLFVEMTWLLSQQLLNELDLPMRCSINHVIS